MSKTKTILAGTIGASLLLAGCATTAPTPTSVVITPTPGVEVYEDDPAFNCFTMGNGGCGTAPTIELPANQTSEPVTAAILSPANDGNVYASLSTGQVVPVSLTNERIEIQMPGGWTYVATDEAWIESVLDFVEE